MALQDLGQKPLSIEKVKQPVVEKKETVIEKKKSHKKLHPVGSIKIERNSSKKEILDESPVMKKVVGGNPHVNSKNELFHIPTFVRKPQKQRRVYNNDFSFFQCQPIIPQTTQKKCSIYNIGMTPMTVVSQQPGPTVHVHSEKKTKYTNKLNYYPRQLESEFSQKKSPAVAPNFYTGAQPSITYTEKCLKDNYMMVKNDAYPQKYVVTQTPQVAISQQLSQQFYTGAHPQESQACYDPETKASYY